VTEFSPVISLAQLAVLKFEIAIIDLKLAKLAVNEWILT
jgi:hypothetical protein